MNRSDLSPYALGRQAYEEGMPLRSCPYSEDDPDRVEWEGAWMEAEEEEEGAE